MWHIRRQSVCLANSRKLNGRCVAGREWDGNNFGASIRPIGSADKGELYGERYYTDGKDPELLDLIEIPLVNPQPSTYQSENHLVDSKRRWRRSGTLTPDQIPMLSKQSGEPFGWTAAPLETAKMIKYRERRQQSFLIHLC